MPVSLPGLSFWAFSELLKTSNRKAKNKMLRFMFFESKLPGHVSVTYSNPDLISFLTLFSQKFTGCAAGD